MGGNNADIPVDFKCPVAILLTTAYNTLTLDHYGVNNKLWVTL